MIIQPDSKLLMIGDSITDYERARPVGEGLFEALGKGYVSLVHVHPTFLGWDRIHPMNRIGHVVIARAFLQAIGYEWE